FTRTKDSVLKARDCAEGNAKTNRRIFRAQSRLTPAAGTTSDAPRALLFFLVFSFIDRVAACVFLRRAIAKIRRTRGGQLKGSFAMQFQALWLKGGPFVSIPPQQAQAVQDALNQFRAISFDVGILDAQDHRAAPASRK